MIPFCLENAVRIHTDELRQCIYKVSLFLLLKRGIECGIAGWGVPWRIHFWIYRKFPNSFIQ